MAYTAFTSTSSDPSIVTAAIYGAGELAPPEAFEDPLPELAPKEREPVATYGNVAAALKAFAASLAERKGPATWWVLFGCGTVVETAGGKEFGGFTVTNSCFPARRTADRKTHIRCLQGNRHAWEALKGAPGAAGAAARRALAILVADGYPHPGVHADRAVRAEEGFWRIVWPHRSRAVYNIWANTSSDTAHGVSDAAAELRRFDCMTPRVFAVIAPSLAITYL
ncbi:MAG TPA: hypothetical protein VNI01_02285 [Elusimicrobiota bacterium]|jgi:hypothetical protein|nr:hypothetical protein [Elusimicrobiota bacterium]